MNKYYIASCSCGKDSLAMVYKLIALNYPLDEIVMYDTGMEFQAIYNNWLKLVDYAKTYNIKCTVLHPKHSFLYNMLEKKVKSKNKEGFHLGYSWCGGVCRWGTTEKLKALDKYCEKRNAFCYVGIANDEPKRLSKERKLYKLFPLNEWKMTESSCLAYCRSLGINWLEQTVGNEYIDLYDILDRVSCWCCANKNLWELFNIWKYFRKSYWAKLRHLQSCNKRHFKQNYSIFDLETKFENGYIPKHRRKTR